MKNEKTIILIRHGRTAANVKGIYIGCRSDVPLSDTGIQEIEEKSGIIREAAGDAMIFSSPLKRARDTAALLFPGRDIQIEELMKEFDFGDFEGKSAAELGDDNDYMKWVDSNATLPVPGGDDRESFSKRVIGGLHNIIKGSKDADRIAIVCHGGNIMAIMSSLAGGDYYDHMSDNLDGFVIDTVVDDERISVVSYRRIGGGAGS